MRRRDLETAVLQRSRNRAASTINTTLRMCVARICYHRYCQSRSNGPNWTLETEPPRGSYVLPAAVAITWIGIAAVGEIFARRSSDNRVDFIGERMTPSHAGQAEFEHLHRYFFAREFCRDKDVLDVAAGEGYGSAYLAQNARTVVGVELSAEMVAHAAASYAQPNLAFRQGDARRLAFAASSFDVVTSFETIEHFLEQEDFVDEVRRVLRPNGVFIVSSPDRDVYSPPGSPANPFHAKELCREEFEALLRPRFGHCVFYAQRPMTGTALLAEPAGAARGVSRTFERRGDRHFEASSGLPRAPYVMAVCSNAPIPACFDSVYIETSDTEGCVRNMTARLGELAGQIDRLEQQVGWLERQRDAAMREAEFAAIQVQRIEASHTWRWTAPARLAFGALTKRRRSGPSAMPDAIR